ncbi:pentatricopeptide repeat-containing protein At1g22960, mitochondrial isoform X4 [Musa acuminata AAA Group]|uniref:pentatricopeptide repeat-containing protein At1g22960, mitochondrial isoform X4 n=1 Tax=Musa acuminata AAA Group TaxID=214697 RepID=UPI0031DC0EF0
MEAKEALNLCSPSLMLFPKFKLLISTTTLAATAAEVRPFHHLLPSIKAYYSSSSSSPVDLPPFDALVSGILDSDPAAFTRGFRAPDSIKPLLSEPHLFLAALRSVRRRPRLALRFFRWAESQPGFPCSEAAFCAVLQILAEGGLMRAAYSVAQRVLHLRLHGIVDLLIDGHAGPEATAPLLDLLLWLYTKCSMVELAVSTFYKMVAHGFLPDVKNCNRILRILRDTAQWTEVRAIYKHMIKVGVQPTIVTFNTILDSFCKEGKAEEALKILGEMEGQDAGCLPNDITYNVIINGLSKKGELDKAEKLLDKMRSGRMEEAQEKFVEMGVCKAANKDTKKKDINICSHKIQKLLRETPLVDEIMEYAQKKNQIDAKQMSCNKYLLICGSISSMLRWQS